MLDRIKVETELSSPFFFSDDSIVISGKASNLYGTQQLKEIMKFYS